MTRTDASERTLAMLLRLLKLPSFVAAYEELARQAVITSYSIHYTKLYERQAQKGVQLSHALPPSHIISCLELPDLQDRPHLFSTFIMWLLADLFADLPEVGDPDKP